MCGLISAHSGESYILQALSDSLRLCPLPASPCSEAFAWMRSMRTSLILRIQSPFSCGLHFRCRRMGFSVPEYQLLISGPTFSSCPPSPPLPPFRRPKNCSLSLSTTTSLCRRSSWPTLTPCPLVLTATTWGARPFPPPCKYRCGLFVDPVCVLFVSSGLHCNTSATQHLLIFHKVRCGVRAGVLLPFPSQAFVAAGQLHAILCPLAFVYLSALCALSPVSCA